MTLFGLLWLMAMLYACLKKNIKYILCLCLFNMTLQSTNVIEMGALGGVGPQLMTSAVLIVKALSIKFCDGKLRITKKIPVISKCLLILLLIEIVFSSQLNKTLSSAYLYIIQLSIYIFCFFSICNIEMKNQFDIYRLIRAVIVVVVALGIIQWLTSNNVLPLKPLLGEIFYNDKSSSVAFSAGSNRLYSTFLEPSYFSGFLVGSFFYLLNITDKWKENYLLMGIIFFELILSTSSTGYGAFAILCLLFVATSKKIGIQKKIILILLGMTVAALLFAFFYSTLDAVIFSKSQGGSAGTRNVWNNLSILAFMSSPIWGTGYKTVRGSSIVYSLLGQIGITGLIIYITANLTIAVDLLKANKNPEKFREIQGVMYAILGCLICEIIACPDLDLCTYWFWIYCAGLYLGKKDTTTASPGIH